jgi:hypothetical protein
MLASEYFSQDKTIRKVPEYGQEWELSMYLNQYRKFYLQRKNIQNYKSYSGSRKVSRVFNSFERMIYGISIFSDELKNDYISGINHIFAEFYSGTYENKYGKRERYIDQKVAEYELKRLLKTKTL